MREEYPTNSWTASWHALFKDAPDDDRRLLVRPGRFANVLDKAVNFYASGENGGDEVLELAADNDVGIFTGIASSLAHHSYHKQELFKGCAVWYGLNAVMFSGTAIEGGWGINARYVANPFTYVPLVGLSADYFAGCTREDLIRSPLFTSFDDARMSSTNALNIVDYGLRTTPGEAVEASASEGKAVSRTTTEYPRGGSGYAVSTDARGKVTVTERTLPGDAEVTAETVLTNGVEVLRTTTRAVFGGGSSVRREWAGTGPGGEAAPAWTEERRFEDYAPDGRRIDYVVTASSDCGTVTNSVAVFDLLGREAERRVPGADGGWIATSNAYDGASSRLLSSTAAGGVSRTTTFLYDACGQPVGMVATAYANA